MNRAQISAGVAGHIALIAIAASTLALAGNREVGEYLSAIRVSGTENTADGDGITTSASADAEPCPAGHRDGTANSVTLDDRR